MRAAQNLYEAGLITYMRTDSTNLSKVALTAAKQTITEMFGKEYDGFAVCEFAIVKIANIIMSQFTMTSL